MSRPRYSPDPALERISRVMPDGAINEFFPANYPGKKGNPFVSWFSGKWRTAAFGK